MAKRKRPKKNKAPHRFETYEEFEAFDSWAFGSFSNSSYNSMRLAWNSLHGDEYFVKCHEVIADSINKMADIWVEKGRPGYGRV